MPSGALISVKLHENDLVHPCSQPGISVNPIIERKEGRAILEISAPWSQSTSQGTTKALCLWPGGLQWSIAICSVLGPRAVETNKTLNRAWRRSRSRSRQEADRVPVRTHNMGRTNCITTELSQKTHWSEVGEEGEKEFQQKEQH